LPPPSLLTCSPISFNIFFPMLLTWLDWCRIAMTSLMLWAPASVDILKGCWWASRSMLCLRALAIVSNNSCWSCYRMVLTLKVSVPLFLRRGTRSSTSSWSSLSSVSDDTSFGGSSSSLCSLLCSSIRWIVGVACEYRGGLALYLITTGRTGAGIVSSSLNAFFTGAAVLWSAFDDADAFSYPRSRDPNNFAWFPWNSAN